MLTIPREEPGPGSFLAEDGMNTSNSMVLDDPSQLIMRDPMTLPQNPSLRFDDWLEQLIEVRIALYLLLVVYYKRYNSGTAMWQNMGERAWSFHALSRHTTLPALQCGHQLGRSPNP